MPTFDHLILNGRPGGGKSELIDFIRKVPMAERIEHFHIAEMIELDDFVWLWEKFVEDDIWEELGEKRLYSRRVPGGYVQLEGDKLLDLLMKKFNYTIETNYLSKPASYDQNTVFVEFARGVPDGGFAHAYAQLSDKVLEKAVIFYISVSFAESCRKNEARYQAALAHSILAHRLPEESIQRFSAEHDWAQITGGAASGYLDVRGHKVPFVTMNNEPELHDQKALYERYSSAMQTLMKLQLAR